MIMDIIATGHYGQLLRLRTLAGYRDNVRPSLTLSTSTLAANSGPLFFLSSSALNLQSQYSEASSG